MNVKLLFYAAFIVSLLAACDQAKTASNHVDGTPQFGVRKSPNDDRDYRYLVLPNNLRVLLVSDPSTDKAAAALTVYRGSFHEPEARPGLAHFLEHMLFIGTGKYPEIDSFQTFITGNGGASNAYTAQDHTNYFFDIQASAFNQGLDRFAHFFIDPLLSPEYVEREKNAVHSEYQMQIKDDGWRGYMASKLALNPAHPGHRFTIGSLETLDGEVGSDLNKFFAENYSADQMGLVVLSNQSIDALETLVKPLFGQIKNSDIGSSYPNEALFTKAQLPAVLGSISLKDKFNIAYNFPMPNTREYYKTKPAAYISNLLGHEGEGSLHSVFNARGWIENLSAGTQSFDRNNSLLSVNIELTQEGQLHIEEITDLLFQYIDLLKAKEPEERIYLEQSKVAELSFRFQEKGSAVNFVSQMAPRLDEYPAQDLLVAPYLMEGFEPSLIRKSLSYLRKDNLLLEISGPNLVTDKIEPWFNVAYSLDVGEIRTQSFEGASLKLPPDNPYLPNNLDLLDADKRSIRLVEDTPELKIWLDTDVEFGAPRANTLVQLLLSSGLTEVEDAAYAELYRRLVNDSLSTTVYPAYLAGLGYAIESNESGYTLALNGYKDQQLTLLSTVADQLFNTQLSPERFNIFKSGLIKDWRNAAKDKPYSQTLGALNVLLVSSNWSPEALVAALLPLDVSILENWRKRKLAKVGVIAGLHGNVSSQDAKKLEDFLRQSLPVAQVSRARASIASISEQLLLNLDVDHNDAAMLIYVQDEDDSFLSRAKSGLAGQLLRSAYFSSLRTEQQLGYVVSAGVRRMKTRGGNFFLVQSPKAGAADLEQATLKFMQDFVDGWDEITVQNFAQQKSGLITRLTKKDKNLAQRSQRYWQGVSDENYNFDSSEQIAAAVETLSKEQMGYFMQDILRRLKTQRVLIFSPGNFAQSPKEGRLLADSLALKN